MKWLPLLFSALLFPVNASNFAIGIGVSNGWNNSWNSAWQPHGSCNLRWHNHWRYRPYVDYRITPLRPYLTQTVSAVASPHQAPTAIQSTQTTQFSAVTRGSLKRLPANARTELFEGQRYYRWQQHCYQLDHQQQRYLRVDCPSN